MTETTLCLDRSPLLAVERLGLLTQTRLRDTPAAQAVEPLPTAQPPTPKGFAPEGLGLLRKETTAAPVVTDSCTTARAAVAGTSQRVDLQVRRIRLLVAVTAVTGLPISSSMDYRTGTQPEAGAAHTPPLTALTESAAQEVEAKRRRLPEPLPTRLELVAATVTVLVGAAPFAEDEAPTESSSYVTESGN